MNLIGKTIRIIRNILIVLFAGSILMVIAYRYIPVYFTPLMAIRYIEQIKDGKSKGIKHEWKDIDNISRNLVMAVIASEDNRFMTNNGFDIEQIKLARAEAAAGKRVRGASTISQQTAKNVFLWPGKTYFRKGLEAYFTLLIEFVWGKERIMEVYLNSIEMGNGIFGAEAVAKSYFKKNAAKLTKGEAALIAASLPNPRRFNSGKPSPYMYKRQKQIVSLMRKIAPVEMGCK